MDKITSSDDVNSALDAHQALWCLDGFRLLGRLHACIDTADTKIYERTSDKVPADFGKWERLELTSFGRKVGGDVPRWWVFDREDNVQKLSRYTRRTFPAVQTLVREADKIGYEVATTYEHIIERLGEFLQRHKGAIEALKKYADDLSAKDELAPAILFSYAVWGSTTRGHRSLQYSNVEDADALRYAGELAVGIREGNSTPLLSQYYDLVESAADAMEEEDFVSISTARLLQRTQIRIRENLAVYFTKLSDSLRHIDTLCQEYFQREHLYADDRFARGLLKKISGQRTSVETDLWDIKETLDMWSVPSHKKKAAAIKFTEQIAAFANSRGGVMLIGVTDGTHEIVGVDDPENRIKKIERVIRDYTDAQVDFVRTRAVPFNSTGTSKVFLVIVVGQVDVPVGVRGLNDCYSFPLRVGPGLHRVSREKIQAAKVGAKGISFSFTSELAEWISDVA